VLAQVADTQGNVTRVDRRFFVGDAPPPPPPVTCAPAPSAGCLDARKGTLTMRPGKTPRLTWTWTAGPVVAAADLGDPVGGGSPYRACLYDGAGALLADLGVPAGHVCKASPCWRAVRDGFKFKDALGRNRGVVQITLKPGALDKARIGVKAKGASLTLPTLPLASAAGTTLQLRRDDDTSRCWQAAFPLTRRNDASAFSARVP
jgi:hypothetical protein